MVYMYLDESGNTGSNWMDPQQPIFVYGGWMIDDNHTLSAKQRISQIDLLEPDKEVKAQELLKKHKRDFYQLVELLIDEDGALPIFVIADKRFLMAAKLVETFFDSAHNTLLKNSIQTNTRLKKALATIICKQNTIVEEFGKIYAGKQVEMKNIIGLKGMLNDFFESQSLFDVASSIKTLSESNLNSMIYEIKSSNSKRNNKRWFSLVYPLLFQLVTNANEYVKRNNDTFSVIVDELSGFNTIFDYVEKTAIALNYNIKTISQSNSSNTELLRAADWLCGYIKECYYNSSTWSKDRSSRCLWKKILQINQTYIKQGVTLFDVDAPTTDSHNNILLLSGNKHITTDYSRLIVEREFAFELKT